MDQSINPIALGIMFIGGGLSMATLLVLFLKHINGQPLLRYEPRRRVPWGGWAVVIVVFFLGERVLMSLFSEDQATKTLDPVDFVRDGWVAVGISLLITAIGLGALAAFSGADRRDMGLPDSWGQFLIDVRIGAIACLAALAPVFLIHLALQIVIRPENNHPLLDQLQHTPSPQVLLTALGAAVLAAPFFEEFLFRLLLQGALERFEDQKLRYSATQRDAPRADTEEPLQSTAPNFELADRDMDRDTHHSESDNPYASPVADNTSSAQISAAELQLAEPPPPHGLLPGLPHGWAPVLASGLLFALAHFEHGVAPIPLILLGMVLGYLYQRTHRIVPCIAAHMLFNAFSLSIAWLQLGGG